MFVFGLKAKFFGLGLETMSPDLEGCGLGLETKSLASQVIPDSPEGCKLDVCMCSL